MGCNWARKDTLRKLLGYGLKMIANLLACFGIGVLVHADFDDSSGFCQIEVMAGLVLVEAHN